MGKVHARFCAEKRLIFVDKSKIVEKIMPAISIDVRKKYSTEQEINLMNAVHKALVSAFKIPEHDRVIRLFVHEAHRFQCPSDKTQPEFFTQISIDCFAGRSIEAKRNLYRDITTNLVNFGIPADHILILLREISTENWGIRGGQAACDVNLGFEVKV